MAYHDDLLSQARKLAHNEPRRPKQGSLRRAVSTAYYALFHLLISETVLNYRQQDLRGPLSRAFEHSNMRAASNRFIGSIAANNPSAAAASLKLVAHTFVNLQQDRNTADYDNDVVWTKSEALQRVQVEERAFGEWAKIRKEPLAQSYLLGLLIKKRD